MSTITLPLNLLQLIFGMGLEAAVLNQREDLPPTDQPHVDALIRMLHRREVGGQKPNNELAANELALLNLILSAWSSELNAYQVIQLGRTVEEGPTKDIVTLCWRHAQRFTRAKNVIKIERVDGPIANECQACDAKKEQAIELLREAFDTPWVGSDTQHVQEVTALKARIHDLLRTIE